MALGIFKKKKKTSELPDLDISSPEIPGLPEEPAIPQRLPPSQPDYPQYQAMPQPSMHEDTSKLISKIRHYTRPVRKSKPKNR